MDQNPNPILTKMFHFHHKDPYKPDNFDMILLL